MATKRKKRIDKAIRKAKQAFNNECLFTGSSYVSGGHVYHRRYELLADCEYNIYPLVETCHQSMDRDGKGIVTSPESRMEYLLDHCLPKYRQLLKERLGKLKDEYKKYYL